MLADWLRKKLINVLAAAWAVVIVLQLLFGGVFDMITNVIFLIFLVLVGQIEKLERWWRGEGR